MNLDSMVRELFKGYESKSPELRASTMKTAASIANAEVFSTVAKIIASENDKKTKAEALKALMRAAQSSFELELFAHVESAFAKADAATKKMLLRLVRFASDDRAVALCRKAYADGLKTEAVKALGEFESALAFEPLVQIAKASSDEREKTIAQIAILDVAGRCGFDDPTAEYIIRNAVRKEDRERAADIMARKPTPRGIELLREIGRAEDADKAQKALSKIKTAYLSSEGEANFRNALDRDVKTRWSNNTHIRKGHWIAFDFGISQKNRRNLLQPRLVAKRLSGQLQGHGRPVALRGQNCRLRSLQKGRNTQNRVREADFRPSGENRRDRRQGFKLVVYPRARI